MNAFLFRMKKFRIKLKIYDMVTDMVYNLVNLKIKGHKRWHPTVVFMRKL